jgi:thioredoxin-like negative regulator of GroEL
MGGFSIVLFYSNSCEYCDAALPVFKALPKAIGGCQVAIINISNNRDLIAMSQGSVVPIEYVPLVIMYVDGKPYVRYEGAFNVGDLQAFIVEVAQSVQKKREMPENAKKVKNQIPEWCLGIPKRNEKRCYLVYADAYKN